MNIASQHGKPAVATSDDSDQFDPHRLVRPDAVHRDVYTSAEIFRLENARLFQRSWLYAGHTSQMPDPGDYLALALAGQPIVLIRQPGGDILAMHNRCAHKGTPLFTDGTGNTGRMLRCAYHGWTYRTDGSLLAMPLKDAYKQTSFSECEAAGGLAPVKNVEQYRGFIFVRLAPVGVSLLQYLGETVQALDNMADRSPTGELVVAGRPLQHRIACNWKMYLENINDAMHPVSAHQSASATARKHWQGKPDDVPKPMAIEQMLPFGASYEFFDSMGARILPNGHSFFGTQANIHTNYSEVDDYTNAMLAAYGEERCRQILRFKSQNTVLYPTLSVKSSPLAIRVLRPVAADETVLEVWAFRAVGAPDRLLERALTYNRVAFSPLSVVAHDDIHLFEAVQQSLASDANPWVSLHRNATSTALQNESAGATDVNSGSEALMRNQFQAWAAMMCANDG